MAGSYNRPPSVELEFVRRAVQEPYLPSLIRCGLHQAKISIKCQATLAVIPFIML